MTPNEPLPPEPPKPVPLLNSQSLLRDLTNNPSELDRFAKPANGDDQLAFINELLTAAELIHQAFTAFSNRTDDGSLMAIDLTAFPLWQGGTFGKPGVIPAGVQARLFRKTKRYRKLAPLWGILFNTVLGRLCSLAIVSDHVHQKGSQDTMATITLQAMISNPPPVQATTWLQDGTANPDIIQACLPPDRILVDVTPDMTPPTIWPIVQYTAKDINRQTSGKVVAKLVRGVLADNPGTTNVGIISHSVKDHLESIGDLKAADGRVGMCSYFGSGLDVASNQWTKAKHDLLIVAGTFRPPPYAIRQFLIQTGDIEAAKIQKPEREAYKWVGRTVSGEPVGVNSWRYVNPAWERAYRALVQRNCQAAARGRSACRDGCRVAVFSQADLGFPIADSKVEPMNPTEAKILQAVVTLTGKKRISVPENEHKTLKEEGDRSLVGFCVHSQPVRTGEIAKAVGCHRTMVNRYLMSLERRGLVVHRGKRGWLPVRSAAEVPAVIVRSRTERGTGSPVDKLCTRSCRSDFAEYVGLR